MENNTFESMSHPNKMENGYEYTEDMDGHCNYKGTEIYANFKMVCDAGGAQTRTLKEVYHFINSQLNWLHEKADLMNKNYLFVNILDGDTSNKNMDKFNYIREKKYNGRFKNIENIYIGDLKNFQTWFEANK